MVLEVMDVYYFSDMVSNFTITTVASFVIDVTPNSL